MINKVVICGVDTSSLPKLSKEESLALLEKIKGGDKNAKNKFITANIRFPISLKKYRLFIQKKFITKWLFPTEATAKPSTGTMY